MVSAEFQSFCYFTFAPAKCMQNALNLIIDIGNTIAKMAVFDGGRYRGGGVLTPI